MAPFSLFGRLLRLKLGRSKTNSQRTVRARWNPAPLQLELLEDRLTPAYNLTLSDSATFNVSRVLSGTDVTYTATATNANANWASILTDMANGLNVIVTSGSGGTEAGNIDNADAILSDPESGGTLRLESGTGTGLVGNVTLGTLDFGLSTSIVVKAAGDVSVTALQGPLTTVSLETTGGSINGGTIIAGQVTATDLFLSAATGIGSADTPFRSRATNLTATTTTNGAGIFITDKDALTLKNAGGIDGVRSNNGEVVLTTSGDLDTGGAMIDSGTASMTLHVGGQDNTFTNTSGSLATSGNVTIHADRMALGTTPSSISAIVGQVTLVPTTPSRTIDLGGTGDPTGVLTLDDAELGTIATSLLSIGGADGADITIHDGSTITMSGRDLELITGGGVTGSGDIVNGAAILGTLTVDQIGNSTYTGSLGGPAGGTADDKFLAFVKKGAGRLTLTGVSTNTGDTTTSAGDLRVDGTTGTGSHTVETGATLSGVGTIGGALTIASGGTLSPGDGGVGTLHAASALKFETGSTFFVDIGPGAAADLVAVSLDLEVEDGTQLRGNVAGPLAAVAYPLLTTNGLNTLGVTGFQDVNGVNMPPPSGGPITVGPQAFSYAYGSGTAFALTPLGTTVDLTSGDLTISDTLNKDDALTVLRNGAMLRVTDPTNFVLAGAGVTQVDSHTVEVLFSAITGKIQINTGVGNDSVTLNLASGIIPSGGIFFDGGAGGNDTLSVVGSGTESANYTPSATTTGNGTVSVGTGPGAGLITFGNLEPVDLTGLLLATVTLPSANDVVNLANGFDARTGLIPALVVSGASGGLGIEAAHLWNNTTVVIDTTAIDGNDTVVVTSANNDHQNQNLTIKTGTHNDSLTVLGPVRAAKNIQLLSTTVSVDAGIDSTGGGFIVLRANDSGGAGDMLTIGSGVRATGAAGTILLYSDENIVQNADVSAAGAADIIIVSENGAVTMSATATTSSNGGNIFFDVDGNLTLGSVATAGKVALNTDSGNVVDANGASTNVAASQLAIAAGSGSIGAGDGLETMVGKLAAVAGAGDATFTNSGPVEVVAVFVSAMTSDGFSEQGLDVNDLSGTNVTLTAASITLTRPVMATDIAALTATTGAIVDGNSALTNVSADKAALSAATGIGVGIPLIVGVHSLAAANSTSGGVAVTDADGFEVDTVGSVSGVTANGQAVALKATAGTIKVSKSISATGPAGSVNLDGGQSVTVVGGDVTGGGAGVDIHGRGLAAINSTGVVVNLGKTVTTTDNGAVTITGTGGAGTGPDNYGVQILLDSKVAAGGTGIVTVTGTGGSAGSGTNNEGVFLSNQGIGPISTRITSSGGAVHVTGIGGANSAGIHLVGSLGSVTAISSGNNAPVTVITDSLILEDAGASIDSGTGTTTIETRTAGVQIDLGGPGVLGSALGLNNTELGQITAGTLILGTTSTGDIQVSANIAQSGKNLTLITGTGVSGAGNIVNGSATLAALTIDPIGNSTYSGAIGGPGGGSANDQNLAFTKKGAGRLTLTGVSTNTGDTTVAAGELRVDGDTGSGTHLVQSGATLSGVGLVGGPLTIAGGGVLSPGDGAVGRLLLADSLTFQTGSTFLVDIGPGAAADQVSAVSTITVQNQTKLRGSVIGTLDASPYPLLLTNLSSSIDTTGFQDINGVNMPPSSGGPVTVGGAKFNYRYGSGPAFELIPIGTTAQLALGAPSVTDTLGQHDTLTVSRNGANLRIADPNNFVAAGDGFTQVDPHTVETLFSNITGTLQLNTNEGDDSVVLDLTGGVLPASNVDGGSGSNVLTIDAGNQPVFVQPGLVTVGPPGAAQQRFTIARVGGTNIENASTVNSFYGPNTADRAALAGLSAADRFVQTLYLNALGRAGSADELAGWVNAMTAGLTTFQVADAIETSPEARTRLVRGWYQQYLGREADLPGLQSWVDRLTGGELEEVVLSGILASDEYSARAQTLVASGTQDQRFVQSLYQGLLNRTASSEEIALWVDVLPLVGRGIVGLGFLASSEWRTNTVEAYYTTLLHRPSEPDGAAGWVSFWNVEGSDATSMREVFEASDEYYVNG